MEPSREELNFYGMSKAVRPNQYQTMLPFLKNLIMSYKCPENPDEQDEGRIILQKNQIFLTDKVLRPLLTGGYISNTLLDVLIPTVTCELENPPIVINSYLMYSLTSRNDSDKNGNEILRNILRTSNISRLLVAPIVRFKHCVLLIGNREKKQFVIYDSAAEKWALTEDGVKMKQYVKNVSLKLEDMIEYMKESQFRSRWDFQYEQVKTQNDNSSCGVHTTIHAALCYLTGDRSMRPEFSDVLVRKYRKDVLKKLFTKQLFPDSPSYALRILKELPTVDIIDPEKVILTEEARKNVAEKEERQIRRVRVQAAKTEHPDWKNCTDYKDVFDMFQKDSAKMQATLKENLPTIERWLRDPNFNFRGLRNKRRFEKFLLDAKTPPSRENLRPTTYDLVREALAQISDSSDSD